MSPHSKRRTPYSRLKNWSIVNRRNIATTLKNVSWLSLEQLVNTFFAAIVSITVARTLGAEVSGTWGLVISIYSIALLVATLGTDQILVVDFVSKQERRETILATALILRIVAAIIVMSSLIFGSLAINSETPQQDYLIRLVAISVFIMPLDIFNSWFRSQLQFNRIVIPSIISTTIGSAARIFFVIHDRSLLPLGFVLIGQSLLMQAMIVSYAYRSGIRIRITDFSRRFAGELLKTSLPILASAISVFIYIRANVFFLDELGTKTDIGLYNAATAISGLVYFIPNVLVTAFTPGLYRLHKTNPAQFEKNFRHLTTFLMIGLSLIALGIMLLARPIIVLLYGPSFAPAAAVLTLHVWTLIPVAFGITSGIWLAAEKRTSVLMMRTIIGGVVNVALNLLLIPSFGIVGAAIATLVAMFVASPFVLPLFGKMTYRIFVIQISAMFFVELFSMLIPSRPATKRSEENL